MCCTSENYICVWKKRGVWGHMHLYAIALWICSCVCLGLGCEDKVCWGSYLPVAKGSSKTKYALQGP